MNSSTVLKRHPDLYFINGDVVLASDVLGQAGLKYPGLGSAFGGSGQLNLEPGPQGGLRLGPARLRLKPGLVAYGE